jgi:NAD(P)-dependent dehydrogenase (short-subunit alcohol dehydrogenase family)
MARTLSQLPCVRLFVHGRSAEKGADLLQELQKVKGEGTEISLYLADMSNLDAVTQLAKDVAVEAPTLDVLINNAGVLNLTKERKVSTQGYELQLAVNMYAPYLLSELLRPQMQAGSSVVHVSSAALAKFDFADPNCESDVGGWGPYAKSKEGITLLGMQQADRWRADGVRVNSVNPASMMQTNMMPNGGGPSPQVGADNCLMPALSDEWKEKTGLYFCGDRMSVRTIPRQTDAAYREQLETFVRLKCGLPPF